MISIIVTSVGHFDDHIAPLYESFAKHGEFEFILMMSDPNEIISRSELTNKALAMASGDWLMIMDNDVRCEGPFEFTMDPGKLYGMENQQGNIKWLDEWCMVIHRSLYEAIGGFDEQYLTSMACGGADYSIRAEAAGWEVELLEAPFVHLVAGTKLDSPIHEKTRQANHAYFQTKWSDDKWRFLDYRRSE